MDRRRPRVAGVPGTLWNLRNAVISRGGDVIRAKKWDLVHTLPADPSAGLVGLGERLFVFGDGGRPGSLPPALGWQQVALGGSTISRVLDAKAFGGALYAIVEYTSGDIAHFYDGSAVTDWNILADAASSFELVAERLAEKLRFNTAVDVSVSDATIILTARVPGTAFTCSAGAVNNGGASTPTATALQYTASSAAVAAVASRATLTITGGTSGAANKVTQVAVGAQNLLAAPVNWTFSNESTANAVAAAINAYSATSGYTAEFSGATVSVVADEADGSSPNGTPLTVTLGGDVTAVQTLFAGGVTAVAAVAQVYVVTIGTGSFDAADRWTITVNGTTVEITGRAAGMATSLFVQKNRVYAPVGRILRYCVLDDATDWTTTAVPATDAGFIDLSSQTGKSARLVGGGEYNGLAALFSRDDIPIYQLDADATLIAADHPVSNSGTVAARSIVPYGSTDTFYLDYSGIRSLKSRDGYDAAFVSDVGSAIDPYVQELLAATPDTVIERAVGCIERNDARYFLAIDDTILVLSYFPSSKITAWSILDAPGAVEEMMEHRGSLYLRSGDAIYRYGGTTGSVYASADEYPITFGTPFMSANDPAARKMLEGFDGATTNNWAVEMLVDPNDEALVIDLGTLSGVTYTDDKAAAIGTAALVAFNFTCAEAGYASMSSMAIHFSKEPGK